ncbi:MULTISPECIES: hypothetical protein [unclassified Dysgonomonas]|uniref:hypothetical protein n=1 Tax=unclassified Dysgonomonas TaxID=2630389 RepID=UPI0025C4D9FB|nr:MULTISPECIES: hypothetical protein [unclassified Dysgonomonas]MDR2004544.1 hypothetical protein [Prevotella sp.]HMM01996.1 hypothetical protein [Dysgonomonas sp.]
MASADARQGWRIFDLRALPSLWRQPLRISSAGGAPTRYSRRRKGRGDSPFVTFSRQTGCGSLRNGALAFCLLLGNAKSEGKPGRARQT